MAFIREYAAMSGDPFSLRIPKKLRKLKVGRFLGRAAKGVLGFIPGVSQLMQVLSPLAQKVVDIGRKYGVDDETMLGFARSYGLDVGDPGAPKPAKKRKSAGAGPKAKAKKKADKRAEKRPPAEPPPGGLFPKVELPPGVGEALEELARNMNIPPAALGLRKGKKPPRVFGGARRTMNPANVRALRRSIRRVEGFQKLVKRVEKQFPPMRRAQRSGHSTGCRCIACKKRAA